MMILIAVISLGVIGVIGALLLYWASRKFEVHEDPRIGEVQSVLPGANCGGCGYAGCAGFAGACVKADSLDGMLCPVGGAPVMTKVAKILGMEAAAAEPKVAVVRCNGSCQARPKTNHYDGVKSCAVAASLYGGETGCTFGCVGLGDCESACPFDAIHINLETGLPVVDEDKCTACGSCVKVCPKGIIELRKKGPKSRRVFVSCVNKDKGAVARKACSNACIGCGRCAKECPFGAITVENNVAYIDYTKCKMCRKCVAVCPTGAIHELNFPPRKDPAPKTAAGVKPAVAKVAPKTTTEVKSDVTSAAPKAEVKSTPKVAAATEVKKEVAPIAQKPVGEEKKVVTPTASVEEKPEKATIAPKVVEEVKSEATPVAPADVKDTVPSVPTTSVEVKSVETPTAPKATAEVKSEAANIQTEVKEEETKK